MRAKLKGLMKVKKTLATGKTIYYCYAWRKGPLLKHKDGSPIQPGDPLLLRAYTEATKDRFVDPSETMGKLIAEFKASSEFTEKSAKTRKAYARYLDIIREEFGDMSFVEIQDKEARGEFKVWRDTMSATPRAADYAWTTLARVLSVAKDRGRISVNVCERGGRLYEADRAEKIWTEDDVRKMLALHKPDISAALLLALWTGQRQGDLLKAAWTNYDGAALRVRQGKTGARVAVPIAAAVRTMLEAMPKKAITILTNTRGKPWTSDGFRTSWGKACEKAGITGLTFHDLRGTAVTRLALSGCSTAQIASITGHSLKDVESILDAHYLGGKIELAEQAILKLEQHKA
ncbi:tyrosine-type recombinase/integrase [Rhizobium sp.]|uniref:tyrosine-type recombinase/integrase n=1 Tax=Rhizobium sp. TaxID=391 RepID=UPI00398273A7